jgi:hypothetical protein
MKNLALFDLTRRVDIVLAAMAEFAVALHSE